MVTLGKYPEQHCGRITTPYGFLYFTQVEGIESSSEWITYSLYASDQWLFSTYDPAGDSLVTVEQLVPGQGEFALTPDDQTVFYTSPGGQIGDWGGPPEIAVFDMRTRTVIKRLSTLRYEDSTLVDILYADEISITPDGRWLVAVSRYGEDTLILINVDGLIIEGYIDLGGFPFLFSPVCQAKM